MLGIIVLVGSCGIEEYEYISPGILALKKNSIEQLAVIVLYCTVIANVPAFIDYLFSSCSS